MKKIGLITINYNGEKNVIDCLKSLSNLKLNNIDLTVYIVDNHSRTGSIEEVEKFLEENPISVFSQEIIKSKKNTGFSVGNNLGIQKALVDGCRYVILLNNDTIVEKNLIEELVKAAESEYEAGIIVPKIYFAPGFEFHKNLYTESEKGKVFWYAGGTMDWNNVIGTNSGVDQVDKGQFDQPIKTEIATGCCMFINKHVIEKIGMLPPEFFMYYEDADYSMKATKKGINILYWPSAVLWHKNAGSSGGAGSTLQDYFISRNRMLFGFRYASLRTKIALFRESIKILFWGRYWQKRGIIDFYLHKFGKGSYATSS